MAKRNSMRDGPLAQLVKATEASQSAEKDAEEQAAPRGRGKSKAAPAAASTAADAVRPQLIDLPEPTDTSRFPRPEGQPDLAVIRVVGVGSGGCTAVDTRVEAEVG